MVLYAVSVITNMVTRQRYIEHAMMSKIPTQLNLRQCGLNVFPAQVTFIIIIFGSFKSFTTHVTTCA